MVRRIAALIHVNVARPVVDVHLIEIKAAPPRAAYRFRATADDVDDPMNLRSKPGRALLAGLALALTACDGAVTVVRSRAVTYSAGPDIRALAASGTNAVVVRNSPVAPQAVLDALRARYASGQYRFMLAPAQAGWNGYTVIVGFGQPPLGPHNQCEDPDIPLPAAPSGRTVVTADYCLQDRLVAEAVGRSPALADPNDPRLNELVGGVVAELFIGWPPANP